MVFTSNFALPQGCVTEQLADTLAFVAKKAICLSVNVQQMCHCAEVLFRRK